MSHTKEDENYRKFFEGTFLIKGWRSRSSEILRALPEDERERVEGLLYGLGEKIGREWAKDHRIRKIDTSRLQKWGNELQKARKKSPGHLANRIRDLDLEVDEILS